MYCGDVQQNRYFVTILILVMLSFAEQLTRGLGESIQWSLWFFAISFKHTNVSPSYFQILYPFNTIILNSSLP